MSKVPDAAPRLARIPDFELLRMIGRGSFGDVWIARNITGALRAIKVVWRDRFPRDDPYEREFRGIQRFARVSIECARQLALLHVGRDDANGFFYSVMELADDAEKGRQIDPERYVPLTLCELARRRGHLPAPEVIRMGVDLAGVLVELHHAGLIHRDIKPANVILVGGVPKLADIGLVAFDGDAHTVHIGTAGYVPPEGPGTMQADIFATGKVLYELSTGLDRADYPRLPEDLRARPDLDRFFELNGIVEKACTADPAGRYPNAQAFLDELILIQSGRSVLRLRSLEKWGRHALRIAAVVVATTAVALWWYRQHEREEWVRREARERQANSFRLRAIELANDGDSLGALPQAAHSAVLRNELEPGNRDAWQLVATILHQAPRLDLLHGYTSHINDVRFAPDARRLAVALEGGEVDLWDVETRRRLWTFAPARALFAAGVQPQAAQQVRFLPGGSRILCRGDHGDLFVWDCLHPSETLRRLALPRPTHAAAVSPDGRHLATASQGGTNELWILDDPPRLLRRLPSMPALEVAFSPDGSLVALCGEDFTARVVRMDALAAPVIVRHRNWIYDVSFSPDGRHFATASADQDVSLWDASDGELLWTIPNSAMVTGARYVSDSRRLLTVARDGAVRAWNTRSLLGRSLVLPHPGDAFAADADAHDHWIAVGGADGILRVWNLQRTAAPAAKTGVSPRRLAGRWILGDPTRSTFQLPPVPGQDHRREIAQEDVLAWSDEEPGEPFLACFVRNRESRVIWTPRAGDAQEDTLPTDCQTVLLTSPERGWLLFRPPDGSTQLWSQRQRRMIHRWDSPQLGSAKTDPHGDWIALEHPTHVELFHVPTATSLGAVLPPKPGDDPYFVTTSAFSPDARFLAVGGSTGGKAPCAARVHLLNSNGAQHRLLAPEFGHEDGVRDLAFSGDGNLLVSVGEDRTARAWNTRDGEPRGDVMRHSGEVRLAAVSPNGTRLLTASQSRLGRTDLLCLWDLTTGQPLTGRWSAGAPIRAIGHLAQSQCWVYESDTPGKPGRLSSDVFLRPMTRDDVLELQDAAYGIMGYEIDSRGDAIPIGIPRQRESFERTASRRDGSVRGPGQSPSQTAPTALGNDHGAGIP